MRIYQKYSSKWLNVYDIIGTDGSVYTFASRRGPDTLLKDNSCDAVRVLPYFSDCGETFVVFANEFRPVANNRILNLPAGLVEKGESPIDAAKRELEEEIGGEMTSILEVCPPSYVSVGLIDEKLAMYIAKVKLTKSQKLDLHEDIGVEIINVKDLKKTMKSREVDLGSRMLVSLFLEKHKSKLISNESDGGKAE